MTRKKLLKQLQQDTWVMLKPSPLHGIGVFAIANIPKGCKTIFSEGIGKWKKIAIDKIDALPAHTRQLVETYCLYDDKNYFIPDYGFKLMDLVLYLNHSATPNIKSVNDGAYFETLRAINEGEELLVNYNELVDDLEAYD
jgi:SET domain-containing protein